MEWIIVTIYVIGFCAFAFLIGAVTHESDPPLAVVTMWIACILWPLMIPLGLAMWLASLPYRAGKWFSKLMEGA